MTKKPIDEKVICILPWIHMHVWPNGKAFPCCMSDMNLVMGNVNDAPMNEIINNDNYKTLRKQMLNGEEPVACSRCYELERSAGTWTLRKNTWNQFAHHRHLIDETNEDGSIDNFQMRYLDIRFSNLCNMKCRTCGPELSSKWYDDQIKFQPWYSAPKFIDLDSNPNFMEELMPHLDTVEEVYFAGGEALITPQHYQILDYWLSTGKNNVKLRYTTNFSSLKYKDKSILDYWNRFKDVRVSASLDVPGEKGEFTRSGTVWDTIVKNRKEMIQRCPDIYFEITPTVSIFSVGELFNFHRSWVENGWLHVDNIRVNMLTKPKFYSITVLPPEHKIRVESLYAEYLDWLNSVGAHYDTINAVKGVIQYMNSKEETHLLPNLKNHLDLLDNVRNENFEAVFPEYKNLWDNVCIVPNI